MAIQLFGGLQNINPLHSGSLYDLHISVPKMSSLAAAPMTTFIFETSIKTETPSYNSPHSNQFFLSGIPLVITWRNRVARPLVSPELMKLVREPNLV